MPVASQLFCRADRAHTVSPHTQNTPPLNAAVCTCEGPGEYPGEFPCEYPCEYRVVPLTQP